MNNKKNSIRIHPHGSGHITNPIAVKELRISTPTAFRKAQNLLIATAKYVKKSGFLSSNRSRLANVLTQCHKLSKALKEDGFLENERNKKGDSWVLIEYLSLFSEAFPNWQEEYEALDCFIPEFF